MPALADSTIYSGMTTGKEMTSLVRAKKVSVHYTQVCWHYGIKKIHLYLDDGMGKRWLYIDDNGIVQNNREYLPHLVCDQEEKV